MFLAKFGQRAKMSDLSRDLAIPYNQLMKVVQRLSKSGIIVTQQGRGGGIVLATDGETVSLKKIIELMDGPLQLVDCGGAAEICRLSPACYLKSVFNYLQIRISDTLNEITIQSIAQETVLEGKVTKI